MSEKLDIFDDEAIAANRDGYMTKAQRRRVDGIRRDVRFVQYFAAGIVLILTIFFLLNPFVAAVIGLCLALPIASVLFFSVWDHHRANHDLHKGLVNAITGHITLLKGRSRPKWSLSIGDKRFVISKASYDVLLNKSNRYYHVYFAPHTNQLLSLEPLGILLDGSQIEHTGSDDDDMSIPLEADNQQIEDRSQL